MLRYKYRWNPIKDQWEFLGVLSGEWERSVWLFGVDCAFGKRMIDESNDSLRTNDIVPFEEIS